MLGETIAGIVEDGTVSDRQLLLGLVVVCAVGVIKAGK